MLIKKFASNRTALITTKIDNKTNKDLNLNLEWTGNIFNQFKEKEDGKLQKVHADRTQRQRSRCR